MPVDATCFLKGAFVVAREVYERVQGLSENNEYRKRIEKQVRNLQKIANTLKEYQSDDLPESCSDTFATFNDSIEICKEACRLLQEKGTIGKFFDVHVHKKELETLESELEKATNQLHLVLTQISISETRKGTQKLHQDTQEIKAAVVHPRQGVFFPNRKGLENRPHKVSYVAVYLDESEDLMVIKWKDDINPSGALHHYEIRYDDENEMTLSPTVEECMFSNTPNAFCVKLGPPKIKHGKVYTIQICAINGAGPGEWSEPKIFRFKTGPPNKPFKPSVIVKSPTEVMIIARRLSSMDENGSNVTYCLVEYTEKDDHNASSWNVLKCAIKQRTTSEVKFKIGSLEADTTYCFRIKMINGVGISPPSETIIIMTSQLIPGPPQNLRVSSKRTDTTIKIRWEEPTTNPQAVHQYKVQVRQRSEHEWRSHTTVDRKSAKITQLKTDTKYVFRVQSTNSKGESGEWSHEIEAVTRFGKLGRTLGTVGAFVGGTVGGPVMGAVGGGVLAGASAGKLPESESGKVAARVAAGTGGTIGGVLFGIVGAPLIGGMAALMVNKKLSGEMEDLTPQTSDDENEPSAVTAILKQSNKMSKDLLR